MRAYTLRDFAERFPGFRVRAPASEAWDDPDWLGMRMLAGLVKKGLVVYPLLPQGGLNVGVPDEAALVREHAMVLLEEFEEPRTESEKLSDQIRESMGAALRQSMGVKLTTSATEGIRHEVENQLRLMPGVYDALVSIVSTPDDLARGDLRLSLHVQLEDGLPVIFSMDVPGPI